MPSIVVIAKITAHQGKPEAAKAALLELIAPTKKEAGCIQYDMHQDNKDSHIFFAYEIWESMAHLEAHGKSEHFQAMQAKTKDTILSLELSLLTKI